MNSLSTLLHLLVCFPGAAVAFSAATARCNGDEGGHQCQEGRHDVPQDLYSETRQCQVSWDRRPCFLHAAVNVEALRVITLVFETKRVNTAAAKTSKQKKS